MTHTAPADSRRIADLGLSAAERDILTVARHFFRSFAEPESAAWVAAFGHALRRRGDSLGPHLALSVLNAIQAMRHCRSGCFRYANPGCPCCASRITANEVSLMHACRAAMTGRDAALRGHCTILCEGADSAALIVALRQLAATIRRET